MYGELEEVLKYIPQKIDEYGLIASYRELAALYDKARTEPSPEITTQMQELLKALDENQTKVDPTDWGLIKIRIFENTGAQKILGKSGFQNLKSEINTLTNDPNGVKEVLNRYAAEMEGLRNQMNQALTSLAPMFVTKSTVPEGMKKIELVFDNKVSVESFGNLVDQSREWDLIVKHLKIMTGASDGDVKIYSISKSSPLVIVIVGLPATIWVLAKIVKEVLDIVEKLMAIKKLKLETEAVELDKELKTTMIENLKTGEERKLNELVDEKVAAITGLYKKNLPPQQISEAEIAARYSIKKIYNFTANGGSVNVIDKVKDGENEIFSQEQFSPVYVRTKELLETGGEPLLLAKFTPSERASAVNLVKKEKVTRDKSATKLKKNGRKGDTEKIQKGESVRIRRKKESEGTPAKEVTVKEAKK